MPLKRTQQHKRNGQGLAEYALLVGGILLTCVLAVAVIGHKSLTLLDVVGAISPDADEVEDNKPMSGAQIFPIDTSGPSLRLDSSEMVGPDGVDRMESLLGPGGGADLIVD